LDPLSPSIMLSSGLVAYISGDAAGSIVQYERALSLDSTFSAARYFMGPSLAGQLPAALADPTLELHDSNGATLASNDDWQSTQKTQIEQTGIPPGNPKESAIVSSLAPGAYTAIVRGANSTIGNAVVEVYNLP
jgi:hypothetical protein